MGRTSLTLRCPSTQPDDLFYFLELRMHQSRHFRVAELEWKLENNLPGKVSIRWSARINVEAFILQTTGEIRSACREEKIFCPLTLSCRIIFPSLYRPLSCRSVPRGNTNTSGMCLSIENVPFAIWILYNQEITQESYTSKRSSHLQPKSTTEFCVTNRPNWRTWNESSESSFLLSNSKPFLVNHVITSSVVVFNVLTRT